MFSCTAGVANNPLLTRQENLVEDSSTRKQSSNVVRAAACKYPGCTRSLSSDVELRNHMVHDHACTECGTGKTTLASLNEHAVKNGHSPYNCSYEGCLLRFSRSDSVERHRATHLKVQKRYPCTHCGKFQGDKAFKQLDHLTQHLRGYHRIGEDDAQVKAASCPHVDCPCFRFGAYDETGRPRHWTSIPREEHAFQSTRDFQIHMRKVHDETPYQCLEAGCERRRGNGYFRLSDLEKHQIKEHGELAAVGEVLAWFTRPSSHKGWF